MTFPSSNRDYWLEAHLDAWEKLRDGRGPVTTEWVTIAEEWKEPTTVYGLTEHAQHPSYYAFGYERPGGGQR